MYNKLLLATLFALFSICGISQDSEFFPDFAPYSPDPIINYGDGFFGAPWNDPSVLKEDDGYIMYVSALTGGLTLEFDSLSIYRMTSPDGYDWTLNPEEPVLEAEPGTYYEGGVETPSVVYYNDQYHMYNTVYSENIATEFKIAHSTSSDGLNWEVDPTPFLEPNPDSDWATHIVAEPGVMIKDDTLLIFFSAAGITGEMSIGIAKTVDGSTVLDSMDAVHLPSSVYPWEEDYRGLSTPSPCMVGDTIYLFTDVAQTVSDEWAQVALHQFKSYGDLSEWHADTEPIHTKSDFTWTDGNYFSEIRSITPLMDGKKLRIWYAGNHLANIDPETGDTTYNVSFIDGELHADPAFWGIGTSEFEFDGIAGLPIEKPEATDIQIWFNGNQGKVEFNSFGMAELAVYNTTGQLILSKRFEKETDFVLDYSGIIFIKVTAESNSQSIKAYSRAVK